MIKKPIFSAWIAVLLTLITPVDALAAGPMGFYGVLDEGVVGGFDQHIPASAEDIRHNWGSGNARGLRQNYTSRLGMFTTEDLGAGRTLEARLEGTLDQAHAFYFDRQAFLELRGDFGSVRVGRTRDLINGIASRVDPFNNDGLVQDKILLAQQATIGIFRIPNSLTYVTPSVDGVQGTVQFGLRSASGNSNALKLLLTWDRGAWGAHAGVDLPSRERQSNGYYKFGPRARNLVAGVRHDLGNLRVAAEVLHSTRDLDGADVDPALPRLNVRRLGWIATARMPVESGEFKFVLVDSEQVFNKHGTWQPVREIGLGYEHFLSKQTFLYLQLGHEARSGGGHWHSGLLTRF